MKGNAPIIVIPVIIPTMQMLNFVNLNISFYFSWNKKRFSHLKAVILVKKKRNIDFTRKEK